MTRILVVDDDRGILNVIRKALEKKDIRQILWTIRKNWIFGA